MTTTDESSGKTAWEYPTAENSEATTSGSAGPSPYLATLSRASSRSDVEGDRGSDSEPAQVERRGSFLMKLLKKNKTPKFDDKSPRLDTHEPRGRLTSYDATTPSSLKNSKSFSALKVNGPTTLAQAVQSLEGSTNPPYAPSTSWALLFLIASPSIFLHRFATRNPDETASQERVLRPQLHSGRLNPRTTDARERVCRNCHAKKQTQGLLSPQRAD